MPRNPRGKGPKLPFHPDKVRQLIKVQQIVVRLHRHVLEQECMTPSQVKAAEILLRKCVPDLSSTTVNGEVNVRYVVHLPEPISREAWLAKYAGDYLNPPKTIEGATNGSGTNGGGGPH